VSVSVGSARNFLSLAGSRSSRLSASRQRSRLVVAVVPVPTTVEPAVMVLPALAVIAIPAPFPVSPIAGMVTILVVAGRDPIGACIRWARPETCTPREPPANRVVVARDPRVLRTGAVS
jgi:hypothetical protein